MTIVGSLLLFKLVLVAGLALWVTIVAFNNFRAFGPGVAALGGLMGMQLFDQAPAISTPLLARRVTATTWHRLIYTALLVLEGIVAVLLWYAAIGFAGALFGMLDVASAIVRANLALSAYTVMCFTFALGGAWFAYYIRQDNLQITHMAMIAVAIGAVIVVNLPGG